MKLKALPLFASLALGAVCGTGCGAPGPTELNISIRADDNANHNTPVAVAALVVYDDDEYARLSELTAGQWFRDAEQRRRNDPDGSRFDLLNWEMQPGRAVRQLRVELKGTPAKGLVFANYFTDGVHRQSFDPNERILVILGEDDYTVVNLDEE